MVVDPENKSSFNSRTNVWWCKTCSHHAPVSSKTGIILEEGPIFKQSIAMIRCWNIQSLIPFLLVVNYSHFFYGANGKQRGFYSIQGYPRERQVDGQKLGHPMLSTRKLYWSLWISIPFFGQNMTIKCANIQKAYSWTTCHEN